MEQVIMAIAAPLARQYGINKAIEIAYEKLGLDIPTQTEIDVLTGGGINTAFSPSNFATMAKRGLVNFGIRSLGSSIPIGPLALAGGIAFLGNKFNPMNPNAVNYSPNLKGQVGYLSTQDGMLSINPNTGLTVYGPGSVLAGKNVMSMFGTNNYQKALDKQINYFENRIKKGKPINTTRYEKAKKEKKDFFEFRADIRDRNKTRSSRSFSRPNMKDIAGGSGTSTSGGISGSVSRGGTDDTPGTPFRRGGIASLYG